MFPLTLRLFLARSISIVIHRERIINVADKGSIIEEGEVASKDENCIKAGQNIIIINDKQMTITDQ